MFADREFAMQVQETMLSINTLLNYSAFRLQDSRTSAKERKRYLKIIGQLMAITTIDVLPELWRVHPDLTPPEFKEG